MGELRRDEQVSPPPGSRWSMCSSARDGLCPSSTCTACGAARGPFSVLEACCRMLWEGPEPQVTPPVRNGGMPNPMARTQLGDNLQHQE